MIKLIIDKVEGYNYYLIDNNNKKYKINIEFYNIENKPKEKDIIYMNKELLNEINIPLSFGPLLVKYGRKIESAEDKDILVLVSDNKKEYLKRYYG